MSAKKNSLTITLIIIIAVILLAAIHNYVLKSPVWANNGLAPQEKQTVTTRSPWQGRLSGNEQLIAEKEALEKKVAEVDSKLLEAQKNIDNLNNTITVLEHENARLKQDNNALTSTIGRLKQQKEELEARLSSLKELKKAMREVKMSIHQEKVERSKASRELQRKLDEQKLAAGNRGFLVRNGRLLSGARLMIEVAPAQ